MKFIQLTECFNPEKDGTIYINLETVENLILRDGKIIITLLNKEVFIATAVCEQHLEDVEEFFDCDKNCILKILKCK